MSAITPVNPVQTPKSSTVNGDEDFVAEFHVMDLTPIKGNNFLVCISKGDRNKTDFLATTVRGPYNFEEMCQEVGYMWKNEQHHSKVILCEKDREKGLKALDEKTIDYIECHYADIITESMLDGVFDEQKDYTCSAGTVDANPALDPRNEPKKEAKDEEAV